MWLAVASAHAGGAEQLRAFLSGTQSLRGSFEQTVTDKAGKRLQQSTGTLELARPGKFRWEYAKPYRQTMVGDGEKVWLYDPDLNQVTVRKLDAAIGSSPAALLAGDAAIEKSFTLKDGGTDGGREWVEAVPKSGEATFERVRMGFTAGRLDVMELYDNFGQTTVIRLSGLERNPKLAPEVFRFTPPRGADVISE